MSRAAQITQLLHKAYYGPAWHGPAVAELLSAVTAAQAAARPAAGAHSIWQLCLHMTAWKDEVRRRLTGPGHKLSAEEDWPPLTDTSESAWRLTIERMNARQQELESAVSSLSPEQLAGTPGEGTRGLEELLHAIIHHDLYHAGQIAILKAAPAA